MKQLIKKIAMVVTLLFVALPHVSAHDFEAEGLYFKIISTSDLTVSVSGLADSSIVDLKIPSEVTYKNRKLKVIAIEGFAFDECLQIQRVNIPEGIKTIPTCCFRLLYLDPYN